MEVKVTIYNIRSDAIRWRILDFLSDGNSNACYTLTKIVDKFREGKDLNEITYYFIYGDVNMMLMIVSS